MASEYRIVLPKTPQGGFSESPDQQTSNAGSPMLNQQMTVKNGIGIGIAAMYGKQVLNAGYQAVVGQIGSDRLEEAIMISGKVATYIALGIATGGVTVAAAMAADAATIGIRYAVETHAISLDNQRTIASRGGRVNYNAGGYYG